MDIYIVRKCKVEVREFAGSGGAKYKLPVMTREDLHSYVIREALTSWQRGKIQQGLEDFYLRRRL